jgi:hypothetical protein
MSRLNHPYPSRSAQNYFLCSSLGTISALHNEFWNKKENKNLFFVAASRILMKMFMFVGIKSREGVKVVDK